MAAAAIAFAPTTPLALLRTRWRLLVVGPLLAGVCAIGLSYLITPTFTATTRLLAPQQQGGAAAMVAQQLGALAGLAGAGGLKNPADQYVAMLRSRTVADQIVKRFDLLRVYDVDLQEDARRALHGNVKTSAGKDGMIAIEVDDHDPKRAAAIANAMVEELRALTRSLSLGEAQQRRTFFEAQLTDAKDRLIEAERSLRASGITEDTIKAEPRAAIETIARLRAAIVASELKLSSMRGYLAETHPNYRLAQQELAALRAQLTRGEASDRGEADLSRPDYIGRYREFKYREFLFEALARQFEFARLDEARESVVIQVVDEAVVPERKSAPKRALIGVITTIATLLVMLAVILVRNGASSGPGPQRGTASD
jgi:tyrosine-protein kinase Etk/Wzc